MIQENRDKALELRKLGIEIAKYPNEDFISPLFAGRSAGAFDVRHLRLAYYIAARAFLYGKDDDYISLPAYVKAAEKTLDKLEQKKVTLFSFKKKVDMK